MKLLLTSEGLTTPAIKEEFLKLVSKSPSQISVAFIPTAAMPHNDNSWIKINKQPLVELGIKTVDDIDLKEYENASEKLFAKLKTHDVIWVNGGNTLFLLYWVKKSGFDHVIKKLLDEGKVYVGVSAGSMLACPTVEVATWKDIDDPTVVQLDDFNALDLVDFFIFVHYEEKWKALVEEKKHELSSNLVVLSDDQAVLESGVII